jgi:hypothetical protein
MSSLILSFEYFFSCSRYLKALCHKRREVNLEGHKEVTSHIRG